MQVQGFNPALAAYQARPATRVAAGGGTVPAAPTPTTAQPASNANLYLMSRLLGNEQDLGALNRWGMASPGMLRFMAGGGMRRTLASWLTGIPAERLVPYGQMADLMRVNGMQPDWAHLLVRTGTRSPAELSRYAGNDIGAQIQRGIIMATVAAKAIETAANTGISYSVPSMNDIAGLAQNSMGLGSVINLGAAQTPVT